MEKSIKYGVYQPADDPGAGEFDRRGVSRNHTPNSSQYYMGGERVAIKDVPESVKGNGKPADNPYADFDPRSNAGKHSANAEFQKKAQGVTGTSHGHGHNGFEAKGKSSPVSEGSAGKQDKGYGGQSKGFHSNFKK